MGITGKNIVAQTMVQSGLDDEVRGRVFSFYSVIFNAAPSGGALILGYIGDLVGIRGPVVVAAVIGLAASLMIFIRRKSLARHLEVTVVEARSIARSACYSAASVFVRPRRSDVLEELAGIAPLLAHAVFGRAGEDDLAAAIAAFGPEVDDPVGGLDDFEIVLDDDDRVALVDQLMQHFEQLAHVVEMQAGGRLVEQIEGAAGGALATVPWRA